MSQSAATRCARPSFAVEAKLFNRPVRFLIDTGADVSLLPQSFKNKAAPSFLKLRAANNSEIKVFGGLTTSLDFPQLRRSFDVTFIVADVSNPILGADFFARNALLIDVKRKRLLDSDTKFQVNIAHCWDQAPHIQSISPPPDELSSVLAKHSAVFDQTAPRSIPSTRFQITTTAIPKPARPYRLSPDKTAAAKKEIDEEMRLGRMVRSSSNYASPFFPVKKPNGKWRFVANYTRLNEVTLKDNYVPPRIDDLLARIPHGCLFSKIDLQKAFFQIPIEKADQHKTAVVTPFGLYEYTVMPMGLKNAAQALQRYVDSVLSDSCDTIAYCDDILLFTDPKNHTAAIDRLLDKLYKAGLVVNKDKSQFKVDEVIFLGHKITQCGYQPSEEKIIGLRQFQTPSSLKQVRRFLGMINFLRKFIPHASEIQQPLTALTKKGAQFTWTANCQEAFEKLVQLAIDAAQLVYPASNDEYTLTTDASGVSVGAVLSSQRGPIGFFSQQHKAAEANYSVYDKELLAVYKAVTHFEWLLFGRPFKLRVDHKPLLHMFATPSKCERRRRQIEYLSTFEMSVEFIPGKTNIVADALSRHNSVDAVSLNNGFATLLPNEILKAQECDEDILSIKPENKSVMSGIWKDNLGRTLVPSKFTEGIIEAVHSVSHSGKESTLAQIQTNYTWPGIRRQVFQYVSSCLACQASKTTRHVKPPFKTLGKHQKFSAIHVDFVGPLPPNKNKRYLFTIFDRGTRWFSAYPTASASTEAATTSLLQWISNFGVPDILISDRGTHFESQLFREATRKLGIEKRRTTAFHPSANGAVERQHRRLKEALKAKSENAPRNWLANLPLVLLGLRNAISKDTGTSAAQATFGRQLSVPGCVFEDKYNMEEISCPTRSFTRKDAYVPEALKTCTHAWLRKHGMIPSLSRPYHGPYEIVDRNHDNHTVTLSVGGNNQVVSMERIKPAFGVEHFTEIAPATKLRSRLVTFQES